MNQQQSANVEDDERVSAVSYDSVCLEIDFQHV